MAPHGEGWWRKDYHVIFPTFSSYAQINTFAKAYDMCTYKEETHRNIEENILAKWFRLFNLNIISFVTFRQFLSLNQKFFSPHRSFILYATQYILYSIKGIIYFEKLFCLFHYLQELWICPGFTLHTFKIGMTITFQNSLTN